MFILDNEGLNGMKFLYYRLWHYLSKESSFHVVSAGVSSQKSDAIQPSTGQIGTEQKSEPMTESQMLSSMAADIPLVRAPPYCFWNMLWIVNNLEFFMHSQ